MPTQTTGSVRSYTDTLSQPRAITNVVEYISPKDTRFLDFFSFPTDPGKFDLVNWPNMIFYWQEDELRSLTSGLAASATSNATTVQVTAGEGDFFRIGDILLVDAEHMYISSIATDTLTVTRNYAGTQASHASSTTNVTRLSIARAEAGSYDDSSKVTRSTVTQYGQIFEDVAEVTYELKNQAPGYGIGDELDYQVGKLLPQMGRMVEQASFRGRSSSSTATSYAFAGLGQLITGNTAGATGTALTLNAFLNAMDSAYADGGSPDVVFTDTWGLRKLGSFFEGTYRADRMDRTGGFWINSMDTPFGALDVVLDRWCDDTRMYLLQSDYVGVVPLTPFFEEPVPATGTTHRRRVYGSYSLVCKFQNAHAWINHSSTT